jgi:hypothetical protein
MWLGLFLVYLAVICTLIYKLLVIFVFVKLYGVLLGLYQLSLVIYFSMTSFLGLV